MAWEANFSNASGNGRPLFDVVRNLFTTQKSTEGAAHAMLTGGGINAASSVAHVAATAVDVVGLAAAPTRRLTGFSINEAAATAAVAEVSIRHGTTAAGIEIAGIPLAADGRVTEWFGPDGIAVPDGVFIDMVAGTAKLTLYYKDVA